RDQILRERFLLPVLRPIDLSEVGVGVGVVGYQVDSPSIGRHRAIEIELVVLDPADGRVQPAPTAQQRQGRRRLKGSERARLVANHQLKPSELPMRHARVWEGSYRLIQYESRTSEVA